MRTSPDETPVWFKGGGVHLRSADCILHYIAVHQVIGFRKLNHVNASLQAPAQIIYHQNMYFLYCHGGASAMYEATGQ